MPNKTSCQAYISDHMQRDSSKRPQSKVTDIPDEIYGKVQLAMVGVVTV